MSSVTAAAIDSAASLPIRSNHCMDCIEVTATIAALDVMSLEQLEKLHVEPPTYRTNPFRYMVLLEKVVKCATSPGALVQGCCWGKLSGVQQHPFRHMVLLEVVKCTTSPGALVQGCCWGKLSGVQQNLGAVIKKLLNVQHHLERLCRAVVGGS